MKKFYLLLITTVVLIMLPGHVISGNPDPDAITYCIPFSDCTVGDGLNSFVLEGIENLESGCSTDGYGDFTYMETSLEAGLLWYAYVETGYDGNVVCIWVDFNNDGEFAPDELLVDDFLLENSYEFYEIPLEIPANAPSGPHRLRVKAVWSATATDPCADEEYGETEDYTVVLTGGAEFHDVGIVSVDLDPLMPPGLVDPQVTLHNFGTFTETAQVSLINDVDYGTSAWVPDLLPGETRQVALSSWNAQLGTYIFHAYLSDPDDNPDNDQFFLEVVVEQPDLAPPQNLSHEVNRNNVSLWWDPPSTKDLLGYNVYNNGVMIANTLPVPFYTDHCLIGGSYSYTVTAVYTMGESEPCQPVVADISLCDVLVQREDFESYTAGQQLVLQAQAAGIDYWQCWSQPPGSEEDPYISDQISFEGNNALLTEGVNDAYMMLGERTSGCWLLDFKFFVPDGFDGFFGIWKDLPTLAGGLEVYFDEDGTAAVYMTGQDWEFFSYSVDSWLAVQMVVDLDADWAKFYLDGDLICQGQWSLDVNGMPGPLKLDMIDFYAGVIWGGTPRSFADHIRFTRIIDESLPPQDLSVASAANAATLTWIAPMEGFVEYEVLRDGEFVSATSDTTYLDAGLDAGTYQYTVAAHYGECQSPEAGPVSVIIHPHIVLDLPAGWSGISSYLSPENPELEDLLGQLSPELQIMTGMQGMYWPAFNINTIGNWNSHDGYQVRLTSPASLVIYGPEESNLQLQLQEGWNLIPVLCGEDCDPLLLFQDTEMLIIKEACGWKTCWPEYGINTIGMLKPGKAYFVKMNAAATIEFPGYNP